MNNELSCYMCRNLIYFDLPNCNGYYCIITHSNLSENNDCEKCENFCTEQEE